jgi:primase-polymerase (primpol)-like protein
VKESDNIGFVFTDTDPYVFIDIDGDKETGSLSPSASIWISNFNSYTEYSPSKTGFHIIIRGKKKDKRCRRGDFEIYEKNRFATFTGDIYQNHTVIESRQDELDRLQRVLFPDDFQNKIDEIENEQETFEGLFRQKG